MIGASRQAEFGTWKVSEPAKVVKYSLATLDEIVQAAVDGSHRFPFGGLGVGGVLYGSHHGDLVRVIAARPVHCSNTQGPDYVLSEEDETGLDSLLKTGVDDPALAPLEPVGWYVSHPRGGISLSQTDLALFKKHFPHSWQIVLVVRPASTEPARFGFFFREPDGSVFAESSYLEAAVEVAAPSAVAPAEPQAPVIRVTPLGLPPQVLAPKPRESWWPVLWVAAGALVLAAIPAAWLFRETWWPAPPPAPAAISLRLLESDGLLRVFWSPAEAPIREARRAWLEIVDGSQPRSVVPLEPYVLQKGFWGITRRSGEVTVRLKVEAPQGEPSQAVARFIGPPPAAPDANLTGDQAAQRRDELRKEVVKLKNSLRESTDESAGLERRVKELEERLQARAARPAKAVATQAPPAVQPPAPAKPQPVTPPAKPVLMEGPQSLPEPGGAPRRVPGLTQPTLELPAPKLEQPKPAKPFVPMGLLDEPSSGALSQGRGSGRLIWTGLLERNGVLSIDKGRPSVGTLTGELPGQPMRLSVSPGELAGSGMTVFSANLRYSRAPVTEQPGAQNGWNRTVYRFDPSQAGNVVAVESPSARNGWNRVVLRAGGRPVSVILLDWELVP